MSGYMDEAAVQGSRSELDQLERSVAEIVEQLVRCRKENEELKSEIESLQKILRGFKGPLPGIQPEGSLVDDAPSAGISYAERLQIKQKLVQILRRIDMELREDSQD